MKPSGRSKVVLLLRLRVFKVLLSACYRLLLSELLLNLALSSSVSRMPEWEKALASLSTSLIGLYLKSKLDDADDISLK